MGIRLFSLSQVPDDEAEEVRDLLTKNGIDFYETHAGGWGISTPALWLYDDSREAEARALLDAYQQRRQTEARAVYEALCREGVQPTWRSRVWQHPLRALLLTLLLAFILYVTLSPFIHFLE